jgi:hypothetical protein
MIIKRGWLGNPRTKWRFLAGNVIEIHVGFSIDMLKNVKEPEGKSLTTIVDN